MQNIFCLVHRQIPDHCPLTPPSSDELLLHATEPAIVSPQDESFPPEATTPEATTPAAPAQGDSVPPHEMTPPPAIRVSNVLPEEPFDHVAPEEIATDSEMTPLGPDAFLRTPGTPGTPWEPPIPSHLLAQTDITEVQ